jgi:hypothetical protein
MSEQYNEVFSLKECSEDLLWFWLQKSEQKTNLCCEKMCNNNDIMGAIVFSYEEQKQYIIPLCTTHASSDHKIYIPSFFKLVEL